MQLLLIEDDPVKLNAIKSFLLEFYPKIRVSDRVSYQSGLLELFKSKYELVLLDMQLPNYDIKSGEDGYKPRPVAGRDILREIKRKEVDTKVVIITQYEGFGENGKFESLSEWDLKLRREFSPYYIQTIQYKPVSNSWKEILSKTLNILSSD